MSKSQGTALIWQPPGTLPKDRPVLVVDAAGCPVVVQWLDSIQAWDTGGPPIGPDTIRAWADIGPLPKRVVKEPK